MVECLDQPLPHRAAIVAAEGYPGDFKTRAVMFLNQSGDQFGGGMLAISAVLGTEAVWDCLRVLPSTFGSSLGGNPIACRVGLESIAIASEPAFLDGVRVRAGIIDERLAALAVRYPDLIREHRGIGMMHGLEFHHESLGGVVLGLLIDRRITSTYSLYNSRVLRVQPPMAIAERELAHLLDTLEQVLAAVERYRAGLPDDGAGVLPPIVRTARIECTAADVLTLLRAQPEVSAHTRRDVPDNRLSSTAA